MPSTVGRESEPLQAEQAGRPQGPRDEKGTARPASGGRGWGQTSYGGADYSDYATVKYSPNGQELWAALHNGPGNDQDFAQAVATDAVGNGYVTGQSVGITTSIACTTVKYSPGGQQL